MCCNWSSARREHLRIGFVFHDAEDLRQRGMVIGSGQLGGGETAHLSVGVSQSGEECGLRGIDVVSLQAVREGFDRRGRGPGEPFWREGRDLLGYSESWRGQPCCGHG